MAIKIPIRQALGTDVQSFPRVQQEKIVEMINAINALQELMVLNQLEALPGKVLEEVRAVEEKIQP